MNSAAWVEVVLRLLRYFGVFYLSQKGIDVDFDTAIGGSALIAGLFGAYSDRKRR